MDNLVVVVRACLAMQLESTTKHPLTDMMEGAEEA